MMTCFVAQSNVKGEWIGGLAAERKAKEEWPVFLVRREK